MILYEAWYGRAPAVAHLRVFDCLCFVKELNQVRKLDDRSRPGMFLGYADGAKAYRVYNPVSRCVLVSRNVVFDEAWMGLEQECGSCCIGGRGARLRR